MKASEQKVVTIKKLKKDRSINPDYYTDIIGHLKLSEPVAMPIDYQYGVLAIKEDIFKKKICRSLVVNKKPITLISSFKMLEKVAVINKLQFDFLHRVWPGDVIVLLNKKAPLDEDDKLHLLMPKNKYMMDIIMAIGEPLYFYQGFDHGSFFTEDQVSMVKLYKECINLIIIIIELCKEYSPPTIVDLSSEDLSIIYEGKVCSDEIKSLYFLDNE